MRKVVRGPLGISVVLFLASLAAVSVPVTASSHSFAWQSAATESGPGHFSVTVDLGTNNDCELLVEGTAQSSAGPWLLVRLGQSWGMFSSGFAAQVHANDAGVDTRTASSSNGGFRFQTSGTLSGEWTLAVISTNFDGWLANDPDDPWFPARFDVQCADPISVVGYAGSREAVGFSDSSMQGTGASANAIFFGASASIEDSISATFTSDTVEVMIADWVWTGAEVYDWTLQAGDETITQSGTQPTTGDFSYTGEGGDYSFTLTRLAAGQVNQLLGWMIGSSPVASLDDI